MISDVKLRQLGCRPCSARWSCCRTYKPSPFGLLIADQPRKSGPRTIWAGSNPSAQQQRAQLRSPSASHGSLLQRVLKPLRYSIPAEKPLQSNKTQVFQVIEPGHGSSTSPSPPQEHPGFACRMTAPHYHPQLSSLTCAGANKKIKQLKSTSSSSILHCWGKEDKRAASSWKRKATINNSHAFTGTYQDSYFSSQPGYTAPTNQEDFSLQD